MSSAPILANLVNKESAFAQKRAIDPTTWRRMHMSSVRLQVTPFKLKYRWLFPVRSFGWSGISWTIARHMSADIIRMLHRHGTGESL